MAVHRAMPILVVEDSKTTVRIVRNLLSSIGFKNVDDAPDGLTALVKMSEKKYELVIADWNMEPMNGYELLKQVRSDPNFARTRIILMTADPEVSRVVAARKAHVSSYIIKPFSAESLKAKIDASFLESSHPV